MGLVLDLFGEPVQERREGRGRPEHVWTQANSNKINLLFACGRSVKDAASVLGISVPTLRKHYFSEVAARAAAALKLRAVQLERLNREAEKGNVAAEKALAGMIQAERMKADSERFADVPKRPAAVGKKQARREEAWSAGAGDETWGDLIGPESRPSIQ